MKEKVNKGHYHELSDRIHVMLCMMDDFLITHPAAEKHPKWVKKLDKIQSDLHDIYQKAAAKF